MSEGCCSIPAMSGNCGAAVGRVTFGPRMSSIVMGEYAQLLGECLDRECAWNCLL